LRREGRRGSSVPIPCYLNPHAVAPGKEPYGHFRKIRSGSGQTLGEDDSGFMETIYLSSLLGKPVIDKGGQFVGKLADLIVPGEPEFPNVAAVIATGSQGKHLIPWDYVATVSETCWLRERIENIPVYEPQPTDVYLRGDVLDKQILDVRRYRVVRVNDVSLLDNGQTWQLTAVDVTTAGLLRRLGLERQVSWLARLFRRALHHHYVPWNQVEVLQEEIGGVIQLKVPKETLQQLHPADVATIVHQLEPGERTEVFEQLDTETAAEALAEVEPEVQASIIQSLDDERAAEIIAEMEPDEAADVLGDLPEEDREDLLEMMEQRQMIEEEEAEDIEDLLAYDDETAGGLMTTDYVAVRDSMTAQEVIDYLRRLAPPDDTIYYLLVVDEGGHLVGVLSLRQLIIAPPSQKVSEFMIRDVARINVEASAEEVAQVIAKYDLLALPVVDETEKLLGVVTFDDALEVMVTDEMKRRWRHVRGRPESPEAERE
jgi:magnesium transporter